MSSRFVIKRGDTYSWTIIFNDADGVALNITGATVFFTVRSDHTMNDDDDNNALISKTIISHTTPASGITTLALTANDTDITPWSYVREIQIKFSNGQINSTSTWEFVVEQDVTKRTT